MDLGGPPHPEGGVPPPNLTVTGKVVSGLLKGAARLTRKTGRMRMRMMKNRDWTGKGSPGSGAHRSRRARGALLGSVPWQAQRQITGRSVSVNPLAVLSAVYILPHCPLINLTK